MITEGVDRLAVVAGTFGCGFRCSLTFRGYFIEDHVERTVAKSERQYEHDVFVSIIDRVFGKKIVVHTTAPCGTEFRGELHRR